MEREQLKRARESTSPKESVVRRQKYKILCKRNATNAFVMEVRCTTHSTDTHAPMHTNDAPVMAVRCTTHLQLEPYTYVLHVQLLSKWKTAGFDVQLAALCSDDKWSSGEMSALMDLCWTCTEASYRWINWLLDMETDEWDVRYTNHTAHSRTHLM